MSHRHKYRHSCNDGLGKRQDDAGKYSDITRPVQHGGFLQRCRQRFHIGLDQYNIIGGYQHRQNINPECVQKPVGFHDNKGGNQAAVDVHCHDKETVHHLPARHFLLCEHISQKGTHQHGRSGSQHRPQHGYPQGGEKAVQLEYIYVIGNGESPGKKNRAVDSCLCGIAEGIDYDIPEGIYADKGGQQH